MGQPHRRNENRDPHDYYPTEDTFTEVLMDREGFEGEILEPMCGTGEMTEIIECYGFVVRSSDLIDRGYGKTKDFFDVTRAENIITNPPYKIGQKVVEHALRITEKKVAMLMKLSFLEGIKRNGLFLRNPPNKIIVISDRMTSPEGDKSQFPHAWFIWNNQDIVTRQTILTWAMAK